MVAMAVNGMQAFLLWIIKSKLSNPIDKDEFLKLHSDNTHKLIAGVAVDFFNKEVVKNIQKVESRTGKDMQASIIDKYDKQYTEIQ